ncbi:hypothetical protein, partial [Providencia manganoxydans]|uniref:hypothetical protein n=1 Tax=Providencia manganoxydans TaxID=2923283 RepID=UPI0032DBA296
MRKLNPTKNPVPSSDIRDLPFNASKIDEVVNSDENIYTDRLGNDRFTIKGLEEAAVSAGPTVEAAAKALEQANEAKKNSDAIKADTENYIRRAETAAADSRSAASNSEASAIRSESAAAKAESIADAAGTYPDIATGLAATEVGQYFRVAQGEGSNVSFIYYRNNAGVAEKATEQPSAQYVEKVRIESTMPQGRLLAAISAALSLIDDLAGDGDSKLKEVAEKLSQISESISKNGDAIQGISVAVSILTEAMTLLKSRHEAENEKMSVMTSLSMLI